MTCSKCGAEGIAPEASRLPVVTRKGSSCAAPAPEVETVAVGQGNSRSLRNRFLLAWDPGFMGEGQFFLANLDRGELVRSAMAGMANVMRGVRETLSLSRTNFALFEYEQRHDQKQMLNEHERRDVSAQWSAKVSEGVAKLKPHGPVVSCQGDWGDD